MHRLEQFILAQLIERPQARYSDLKPKHMEGSLFTYHLRQLMKRGYIEQTEGKQYTLSSRGKLYADNLQLSSLSKLMQPTITVLIACRDDTRGWLLFRRGTHPTINMTGFPKVTFPLGNNLLRDAEQTFLQDTGLDITLAHRGDGYIRLLRDEEPESYIFFHLLAGENPQGALVNTSDAGEYYWDKTPDFKSKDFIPSMPDLARLLTDEARFFAELTYHL